MTYVDNLCSAPDSDVEPFSNELSPIDGYFSNRDHPQHVMVPDPSLETGGTGPDSADSKVREAGEEAVGRPEQRTASTSSPSGRRLPASSPLRVAGPTSSTTYSPSSSSSSSTDYSLRSPTSSHRHYDDLYSETSALLHSVAPPPAYSAATSQPSLQHFNTNYSTTSTHQLGSGIREPERMGRPHDFNERSPLCMKQVRGSNGWRLFRNILLITLVLGLAVGFMVAAFKSGESSKDNSSPDKSPSTGPESGHGSYCPYGSIHDSDALPKYEFESGRELVILQVAGGENFRSGAAKVQTTGEIILRRLDSSKVDQRTGYITFDVWLSERGISYSLEMDSETQALKIVTPDFANLSSGGEHCISLEITVWIPPGANFENVLVGATSLSIRFMDDVDFHVSQHSRFETYSGDVYFSSQNISSVDVLKPSGTPWGFSSLEVAVETSSGDITGTFPLYDLVHIETDSGQIDITVLPQPSAHGKISSVAQLTLSAASGNIQCHFPVWDAAKVPDRDYRTSVQTHSGVISGDYVIGTEAFFKVISGDLEIVALPTTFERSTFQTETNSGSTRARVLEPLSRHEPPSPPPADNVDIGDDDPYLVHPPRIAPGDSDMPVTQSMTSGRHLTLLTSNHDSGSGGIKIQYPGSWDGEIRAVSISGDIRVGGQGVRIVRDSRKNWAYREVVARKGAGAQHASSVNVRGISGDLDVWVGRGCAASGWCK